jgi:hypothetical protein
MEGWEDRMTILLIIGIILIVLWLVGLLTSFTLGGLIYILLAIGVVLLVIWLVRLLIRRRG